MAQLMCQGFCAGGVAGAQDHVVVEFGELTRHGEAEPPQRTTRAGDQRDLLTHGGTPFAAATNLVR